MKLLLELAEMGDTGSVKKACDLDIDAEQESKKNRELDHCV